MFQLAETSLQRFYLSKEHYRPGAEVKYLAWQGVELGSGGVAARMTCDLLKVNCH